MLLACPVLDAAAGLRHGFFTRRGGVSHGLYSSLNCGYGSGDEIAQVRENRRRVTEKLGQPGEVLTAYQIHSSRAVIVDRPWQPDAAPEGDALVTAQPHLPIGVLAADCLPILLADPEHRVIAAAHAGWKGAISGIIEATVEAMQSLGAQPGAILATIGPGIGQASYEVSAEFRARFLEQDDANQLYFLHGRDAAHFLFDLPAYAKDRLKNAGIAQINLLAQDTCLQEDSFFSYRRAALRGQTAYGRQISAIALT